MGRPKLPTAQRRTERIEIRLTKAELAMIKQRAENKAPSVYLRERGLALQ